MYDLDNSQHVEALTAHIAADVESYSEWLLRDDLRRHLGASIVGHECSAYVWNSFRWLKEERFSGRMRRLFERGHLEERRFVKWLEGIGFQVTDIDPATAKQIRIAASKGHFGGSCDSVIIPPARYGIRQNLAWLGEFKTHNDKSFKKLQREGVARSKPEHFAQMSVYGYMLGLEWGFYCAVNKNDDDLYFKIVRLDYNLAQQLLRKADALINTQSQPMKVAASPTYQTCKYCHFSAICFHGAKPEKNCRSCVNARPIEDKQWWCDLHSPESNAPIPDDVIRQGCPSWQGIINP